MVNINCSWRIDFGVGVYPTTKLDIWQHNIKEND